MKFLNITTTGVKIQQHSNLMKFLNLTTTGVTIQQAQQPQQPNEISEYRNSWGMFHINVIYLVHIE